jgi:hypothetical protein
VTRKAHRLIASLPPLPACTNRHDEIVHPKPKAFIDEDGRVCIHANLGDGAAEYYGQYRNGLPWISRILMVFAKQNNMYWQWRGTDTIVLHCNQMEIDL